MQVNNIIFDFDGTLGDSKECGILATKAAFKEMHLKIPSTHLIEHYMGIPIEKSFKEMVERKFTDIEFEELLALFRQYYKNYENQYLRVFPGVKEVLEELKKRSLLLFIVSSKKTNVLHRNLISLGIDSYFKEIIGSDKVCNYKPDPEGITYILEKYKLNPDQTLMVGDAIFDIQMGKAGKVRTCAVTWGSHSKVMLEQESPDILIDTPQSIISSIF